MFSGKTPYLKVKSSDYKTTGSEVSKQLTLIKEKWYLLTITFDGKDVSFYFDGKPIATTPLNKADATVYVGDGDLYIGANSTGGENQHGYMDDLRLYNKALSVEETLKLYTDVIETPSASASISMQINEPLMTVNNVQKEIDPGRGTKPLIHNNRTVVPISSIIKEIGGTVNWVGEDRRVEILYKGKTVKLWIDKFDAEVNGEKKTMDTVPIIINDRTMLPLRFVAESLGLQVDWEATKQEIVVRYTP